MATIEVVAAGADDEAELIRLARAFHAEHGYGLSETSITGLSLAARGHDLARAWLARDHARSLGYAVLARGFAVDHGGPVAVLDDLYVVPDARSRGVGATLIARLEHEARELGLAALLLVTDPGNPSALRFYGAHGFAPFEGLMMVKPLL